MIYSIYMQKIKYFDYGNRTGITNFSSNDRNYECYEFLDLTRDL